ncbi:carbohydrate porin [Vibrio sp. Vb2880]|uniref:carbohydrate porin n=1 Tax=Vibrio TaxID=662 RepID=UPI0001B92CE6|nr:MULTISPECIES: carbohydrate porin [Vibrio]EEX40204.1 maltoporin [Vibrio furnissii CIP 102972]MBO0213363.1 carbohydrate porin [Vibrio sp. Vb2880]MCG6210819.1 carbohydrate porin [Vibrio furnissii]MCG6227813.1 carbohydrate porin [Vibrio furnissii]MCG6234384.1 carbohydrate porin [Vibrio furnissii]
MRKVSVIAAAVVASLAAGSSFAEDKVNQGWQINGYGHLLYNAGQSLALNESYEHRRDYRAAGASFSGNPNQVEFTVTRGDNYDNGAWSKYVLKTEYGNNEGSGRGFYTSSSGSEGFGESGQLEFKEAYVELGDLSYFPEGLSIWAGKRYLNRQAGIITKEFWKQSSGVGGGIQYKDMGIAVVSADAGDSYNSKLGNVDANGSSTTLTSVDLYYYGVEALSGRFDFDAKIMSRKNVDEDSTAKDGYGLAVTYSRDYYGLDGWTTTALTYGSGIASTKGVNFGQWNGGWDKDDESIFLTSYGVLNVTDNLQIGTELVYWKLYNDTKDQVWGSEDGVDRFFFGATPSYKFNENFRLETTLTYAVESLGNGSDWGREKADTSFYTATIAPVFTVNADYFGRPQIKPYVTYMKSSEDNYGWSNDAKGDETRFGVEAEIWF